MMNPQLYITEDGSHTLYADNIDECYHSSHGALQESKHIFIDAGLKKCHKKEISIFEVGFGTGLNALLALQEAVNSDVSIHYCSIEKFPVEASVVEKLNYPSLLDSHAKAWFEAIHQAPWNEEVLIHDRFVLEKLQGDFTDYQHKRKYDLVFFDAFSPEKQPEMWSESLFRKLYEWCADGAVITTYCAKGVVRRALQAAGFTVERLPGPPGKREILRGTKIK